MKTKILATVIVLVFLTSAFAQKGSRMKTKQIAPPVTVARAPLASEWPLEKSQPIVDKTQTIRLAPDLSQLSAGERNAVAKLLEVGKIFQNIYEDQRHKQALSAYRNLQNLNKIFLSPAPIELHLFTLYRLNQGPIATTLD